MSLLGSLPWSSESEEQGKLVSIPRHDGSYTQAFPQFTNPLVHCLAKDSSGQAPGQHEHERPWLKRILSTSTSWAILTVHLHFSL